MTKQHYKVTIHEVISDTKANYIWDDDTKTATLIYEIIVIFWVNGLLYSCTLCKGFTSDLFSAPESLLRKLGIDQHKFAIAALTHDWLYKHKIIYAHCGISRQELKPIHCPQKLADLIYKQLLKFKGMNDGRAHFMYKILRNWGWFAYFRWSVINFFNKIGLCKKL